MDRERLVTAPASVLTLFRAHLEAAVIGIGIVSIVAAVALAYRTGRHAQATDDAVSASESTRTAAALATSQALRAVAPVRAENARLKIANASLKLRGDTLERIVAERKTSANLVRSRLVLHADSDSVTLVTDSGPVKLPLSPLVAQAFAAERMAVDSEVSAMERRHDNDTAQIAGARNEIAGLTTEIALDSVVQNRYRAELSAAQQEIDVLKKANQPRFTFTQGAVAGALAVVAARIALALLVHK